MYNNCLYYSSVNSKTIQYSKTNFPQEKGTVPGKMIVALAGKLYCRATIHVRKNFTL